MQIEKIQKMKSGKYKIIFGNNEKIITYDDVILKNNLLFNSKVDSAKLNNINTETKYYDIYYKVIKFITNRLRSEKEINDYLDKGNIILEDKQKIIASLKNIGLINDDNFVRAYISDKIYLSNIGPLKIKKELLNHEIDETIIDKYIADIDCSLIKDKVKKIVDKKIKLNKKYSLYLLKQKLFYELINLGYDNDIVNECLNNLKSNDDVLIREYKKVYDKLKLKYTEEELAYQVKKKLYTKGFSVSEIEDTIKKMEN